MILQDKYINPFTDFGFKKLFGEEPNKDLLIDFLNELLPKKHTIEDLTYSKNEFVGNTSVDRKAIFDLYCKSTNGDRFLVEVQKAKQDFFKDRSIFYSSFPIQEQAQKGDWDFELSAVYTIGILDFTFADHKNEEDKFFHQVQLKDQDCNVFFDKLSYLYLELPKFKKEAHQLENKFEKWLYVFRYLHKLQERPVELQDRIFQRLFEVAEIAKFSSEEREAYNESLKIYRDIKNVVDSAKREGREEEREKGIIRLLKQGILSDEQIAEVYDVSVASVSKLRADNQDTRS